MTAICGTRETGVSSSWRLHPDPQRLLLRGMTIHVATGGVVGLGPYSISKCLDAITRGRGLVSAGLRGLVRLLGSRVLVIGHRREIGPDPGLSSLRFP